MTTVAAPRLMTNEEFLALPEVEGVERELIRGVLQEKPMTRSSYSHSRAMTKIAAHLEKWLATPPEPRGAVVCGEVGVRLRAEPGTTVGVDVAYISAATVAATPRNARLVEGAPVLVVEILSPTDEHEDVVEKIEEYLDCGVGLVWLADPAFCTVTVYRADARPALFNADQEMPEHPLLPGLRAKVAEFFG